MTEWMVYLAVAAPVVIWWANKYEIHRPTFWVLIFIFAWNPISKALALFLEGFFS